MIYLFILNPKYKAYTLKKKKENNYSGLIVIMSKVYVSEFFFFFQYLDQSPMIGSIFFMSNNTNNGISAYISLKKQNWNNMKTKLKYWKTTEFSK